MSPTLVKRPAVFLDKDGTLIEDLPFQPDGYSLHVLPGVLEGLRVLHHAGYLLVVVTNQAAVAKGTLTEEQVQHMEVSLRMVLSTFRIPLAGFYYCPHHPEGAVERFAIRCLCRKPGPGMLIQAARELNIDLEQSWMVGDILHDVEAGRWAGCRTVLIDNGHETEWLMNEMRWPDYVATGMLKAAQLIVNASSSFRPRISASQETADD